MKKIAIVGNASDTLIIFRLGLIKKLREKHQVYTFCPDYKQSHFLLLTSLGVIPLKTSFSRFGTNPLLELRGIVELALTLRKLEMDVVFGYFIKPAIYSIFAGVIARVPRRVALVEGMGYFFTDKKLGFKGRVVGTVLRSLLQLALPRSQKVIFLNRDDLSLMQETVGANFDFSLLGGIGVDLDHYFQATQAPDKETIYLFIGRILKEKGVWEFIEAASIMRKKNPQARFWIVGGTDQNPGAIRRADLLRALEKSGVEWFGETDDVRSYLQKCHVFVLPSYREGFPRSSQEAMAMGKAIITTDVPGCRETVEPDQNGILVKSGSSIDLSIAMERYLEDPNLIVNHGNHSRVLAEKLINAAKKDLDLMNSILGVE